MGLYLTITDDLYMIEAIIFQGQLPANLSFSNIEDTVNKAHILETVALELSWTSIFAVKFSFLFFFKTLVNRIRPMTILWQVVVAATTVAWVVGCLCAIMECPYFGANEKMCMHMQCLKFTCQRLIDQTVSCATSSRTVNLAIVLVVGDIVTDLAGICEWTDQIA